MMQQVSPRSTEVMASGPPFVGNMHHVQAQARIELGKRHVRAGAIAGAGVVVPLPGLALTISTNSLRLLASITLGLMVSTLDVDQRAHGHEVGLHVEGQALGHRAALLPCVAAVPKASV